MFDNNLSDETFKTYANVDKIPTLKSQGTGLYQCFCKEFNSLGLENETGEDFCEEYTSDISFAYYMAKFVSFAIVFINIVIRKINIRLIDYIGYYTESEQTKAVK